ncbi:8-amino-7-oxononanoate synthase [Salinimicrobium sediminis]|uniref:8-amino-7-oxononanoate synthase n=1 Tax=Salinimicrobium sediminis TaxID=1343891 RepID=A0A285X238_9FLAO|nr:8-amino-7-oxononanoate synthase [Salinimicrobium sediminis]SOC79086.1 8-amino-7-oxononanoate synthase [Salinimicrobium sediminis]
MSKLPIKIGKSLENRKAGGAFRVLKSSEGLLDFSSNDYLGFAGDQWIFERSDQILKQNSLLKNGSGGSRLLTGNHQLFAPGEDLIAAYHKAEAALIFNSGYDANVGFFSAVPGRGDYIFYDELIHASIRDGIGLSAAKAIKFRHNDVGDLQEKIRRLKNGISGEVYIVTESIFSMDGDSPNLTLLATYAEENNFHLVIDEAHAVGIYRAGIIAEQGLQEKIFARIVTFGKALGTHGAAVLGSKDLRDYLINFSRSFIYSTALAPHSVAAVIAAYENLKGEGISEIEKLRENIRFFKAEVSKKEFREQFLESDSAIHCFIIPGNKEVKAASQSLAAAGFDVRPILSPTVPAGRERLRICLHSFNSKTEIEDLFKALKMLI